MVITRFVLPMWQQERSRSSGPMFLNIVTESKILLVISINGSTVQQLLTSTELSVKVLVHVTLPTRIACILIRDF